MRYSVIKPIFLGLIWLATSGCLFVPDGSGSSGTNNPPIAHGDYAKGLILVCMADGAKPSVVAAALRGIVAGERQGLARIKLPAGSSVEKAVAEAAAQPGVLFAEPLYIYRSDAVRTTAGSTPEYAESQRNTAQSNEPHGEDATGALSSFRAAIIDSGIQAAHPGLAACVVGGYNAITDREEAFADDAGSGTLAAGIIGAGGGNGEGLRGVAPGIKLLAVKVLNSQGYGYSDDIAAGIRWAADPEKGDADLINLGLTGKGNSQALQAAINYAVERGVIVIAAMGESRRVSNEINYPAACSGAIPVGAAKPDGTRADGSGCGDHISVLAPGVDVPSVFGPDGFAYCSGTAAAAAHVTGLAALLLAKVPSANPAQIRTVIEDTAVRPDRTIWDVRAGYGLIDPPKALAIFDRQYPAKYCALTILVKKGSEPATGAAIVAKRASDGKMLAAGRSVEGKVFFAYLRVEKPDDCLVEAEFGGGKSGVSVGVKPGGSFTGEIIFEP